MRKTNKLIMCLLLVVAMIMQLASVSFAAISTTTIGAVSYTYDAAKKTYTASVATRGLENDAMLVIAEYDASGNVKASDVSRTAANAKDGFLKASVEVSDEANEVKAFVWDKDYAPFNLDTALSKEYSAKHNNGENNNVEENGEGEATLGSGCLKGSNSVGINCCKHHKCASNYGNAGKNESLEYAKLFFLNHPGNKHRNIHTINRNNRQFR